MVYKIEYSSVNVVCRRRSLLIVQIHGIRLCLRFGIVLDVVLLDLLHIKAVDLEAAGRTCVVRLLIIVRHHNVLQALIPNVQHRLVTFACAVPVSVVRLRTYVTIRDHTAVARCIMHRRISIY